MAQNTKHSDLKPEAESTGTATTTDSSATIATTVAPKTGDNNSSLYWAFLMLAGMGILGVAEVRSKKRMNK